MAYQITSLVNFGLVSFSLVGFSLVGFSLVVSAERVAFCKPEQEDFASWRDPLMTFPFSPNCLMGPHPRNCHGVWAPAPNLLVDCAGEPQVSSDGLLMLSQK